jgi:hypothetical protein
MTRPECARPQAQKRSNSRIDCKIGGAGTFLSAAMSKDRTRLSPFRAPMLVRCCGQECPRAVHSAE